MLSEIAPPFKPNVGGGERAAFCSRSPSPVAGNELPFDSTGRPGDPGEEAALVPERGAARRTALEVFPAERSPTDCRDGTLERRLSIATNVLRDLQIEVSMALKIPWRGHAPGASFSRSIHYSRQLLVLELVKWQLEQGLHRCFGTPLYLNLSVSSVESEDGGVLAATLREPGFALKQADGPAFRLFIFRPQPQVAAHWRIPLRSPLPDLGLR